MAKLAILGGRPVRSNLFPSYQTIGQEEKDAANAVFDSGVLSNFIGAWHPNFYGGDRVLELEQKWALKYQARHAVSVNSATSGLYAAVGAAGVGPGDEVIVSPYTMSASVTAPLIFNAVPVFADIDPDTYCISAETIRQKITPRTKAIIVVHIFGQPADMDPIMRLAAKHNLVVIEDCAQVPVATYGGRPVGTLGHMGVFSLNYHKHIHCGEGGIVTTNDGNFSERLMYIRNHAETVAAAKMPNTLVNMIGFNFRLGEIEAAIAIAQLDKADGLVEKRIENVRYLESKLGGIDCLKMPYVTELNRHVYYVHALKYDATDSGVPRDLVVDALKAELPSTELREKEGALIGKGYVKPLYHLPIFQNQMAYGNLKCPFQCPHYEGTVDYAPGLCPNAETAHFEQVITHELMRPGMSSSDLDDVADAFDKVFENLDQLRNAHQ